MRDYGKVPTALWTEPSFLGLSDQGKVLALYLLSSPHTTMIGAFRLPDGYVAEDLRWSQETVSERFRELFDKGFATRCEESKWVVVPKFCLWNEIENPNQAKAGIKLFHQVPDGSWVKPVLARALRDFAPKFPAEIWRPFETVDEGLVQPFRNQEQEQEQKQEKESNPNGLLVDSANDADDLILTPSVQSNRNGPPDCPHQQIIALYHEILPTCQGIREWTPARAQHLRARWNEDPKRQTLDYWKRFFEYVAQSDFLTGKAGAGHGRSQPFRASLDWIVKSENFAKIREGRYHHDQEAA